MAPKWGFGCFWIGYYNFLESIRMKELIFCLRLLSSVLELQLRLNALDEWNLSIHWLSIAPELLVRSLCLFCFEISQKKKKKKTMTLVV